MIIIGPRNNSSGASQRQFFGWYKVELVQHVLRATLAATELVQRVLKALASSPACAHSRPCFKFLAPLQ